MNMWNGQCANVVNQMPANTQKNYEHHSIQSIQHKSPPNTTKIKKEFFKIKNKMSFSTNSQQFFEFDCIFPCYNRFTKKYGYSYGSLNT